MKINFFIARRMVRLLGVFKRKQEGGKEILISLPMDFERPSLSLVRTMERQGFYDEWQECSPMTLRSQYEIQTKTWLQWLVDLLPKALSCTQRPFLVLACKARFSFHFGWLRPMALHSQSVLSIPGVMGRKKASHGASAFVRFTRGLSALWS